jgi:RimJ/RimL family protein N-acetyltransferase
MRIETPINSEHIVLRTLQPADATAAYLGWLSDPVVNVYLEVRFSPPMTANDLEAFIDEVNASSHTLMLGIFLQEGGCHIGNIKLGPIDWNHQVGDIGFLIGDKEQWGKGYASKAIGLLSDYAFEKLGLMKLTAGCYAQNEGSRRALLKAGYIEEGRRVSQWVVAGCRQDGILLGRINPHAPSKQS